MLGAHKWCQGYMFPRCPCRIQQCRQCFPYPTLFPLHMKVAPKPMFAPYITFGHNRVICEVLACMKLLLSWTIYA